MVEDGEIVALLPLNLAGGEAWSHQGLTFGGLIVADARTEQIMAMLDAAAESWRAAGASRFMVKPFDPEIILAEVQGLLSGQAAAQP